MSRLIRSIALIVFESGLVFALAAIGSHPAVQVEWSDPNRWLASTPLLDVVATGVYYVAVVLTVWIVASTAAMAIVRVTGARGVVAAAARRLSMPVVKRLVEGGLVVALSAPGVAAASLPIRPGPPPPPVATTVPVTPPVPAFLQPVTPSQDDTTTYVVRRGDNFWAIATGVVRSRASGVTTADVAAYWRTLIASNRDRIRSGDPDLIYPGEEFILP